jgi:hypothetical protein
LRQQGVAYLGIEKEIIHGDKDRFIIIVHKYLSGCSKWLSARLQVKAPPEA